MVDIVPLQTGRVRVKASQRQRAPGGLLRVLFDRTWTEWLPILAWAIRHPEGVIVVDTGETARTADPDYFPRWHPYYRTSVQMDVAPGDEIGPQLMAAGIDPAAVRKVVLTHLHTDHAGGLHHVSHSELLVHGDELASAQGLSGKLQGYLPHRWPDDFAPTPIPFAPAPVGPFGHSYSVTEAGDVVIVPTPGHAPGHVSVIVKTEDVHYVLAGDTSYSQQLLLDRMPDGVSPDPAVTRRTMDRLLDYAETHPTVYLPSHDPQSVERLRKKQLLQ